MNTCHHAAAVCFVVAALTMPGVGCRKKPSLPVEIATTPEIAQTGLVQSLTATFQRQSGVAMKLRIVEEEEALRLARARNVQVIVTDHPDSPRMYRNLARLSGPFAFDDFTILGPSRDPAHVRLAGGAVDALRRIAKRRAPFCSPVDVAHIRRREKALWTAAGVDPKSLRYSECHGDAVEALREAGEKEAYTISDTVTTAAVGKNVDIEVLLEGTTRLHDDYSAVLVAHTSRTRRDRDAEWFVQWLTSYRGREAVQSYLVDGMQRFSVRDTRRMR